MTPLLSMISMFAAAVDTDPAWSLHDVFASADNWSYYWPKLLVPAALAVGCGLIGVFVLLRREALVALVLPEAVVTGASIAMLMHWENRLPPAIAVTAAALVLLALVRGGARDALLPALYAGGMCLPFLVIADHGGEHLNELQQLFIGHDKAVALAREDAYVIPVALIAATACGVLWRRWLLLAQSPTTARLARVYPLAWDFVFLALVATVVLVGVNSTGMVMVLGLLFLPAATALPWVPRVPATMALAVLVALIDVAAGFYLSNRLGWPYSQSVGGVGFVLMVGSQLAARFV
jgi:ABC-type Mn2+/Zn2+ transport system permease subunit